MSGSLRNVVMLMAISGVALLSSDLFGQGAAEQPAHGCFRGRPSPPCSGFWLTEAGVAARLAGNQPYGSSPLFTWELGWMHNHGTRSALGIAAFGQAGGDLPAAGIRPRLRLWMNSTMSLDIAPGIALIGSPGFSGHVGVNLGDYAAATVHVVALRPRTYDTNRSMRTGVFLGGRLGSVPGTIAGVGGPIVLLTALVIACRSGGCND